MKAVLVHVRVDDRRLPPLGIGYLASYLKNKGIEVIIIDPTPKQVENGFNYTEEILEEAPDLIGFKVSAVNYGDVKKICDELKEKIKTPIILGGPQITACPTELLYDYNVIGEGEETLYQLTEVLNGKKKECDVEGVVYRSKGKIKKNKERGFIQQLDDLPEPMRESFPLDWYFHRDSIIRGFWGKGTSLLWSRGCPYNCLFCTSRGIFGRKIRLRKPQLIVDEIEKLKLRYNLKYFYVLDDILNVDKAWTGEICEELIKRKLNIRWAGQIRVDRIDKKSLNLMKRSGCVLLEFGCESGSPKVLNIIRKGITTEQIKKAFYLCREIGIKTLAYFMIGNPGEAEEDFQKTVRLAERIKADYYEFSIASPYPGSELWDLAIKNDWLKDMDFTKAFHTGDKASPIMEINFTKDELIKKKNFLYNKFKSRYITQFLSQKLFLYDLITLMIKKPKMTLKMMKHLSRRDFEKAGWVFFHEQRKIQ